MNESESLRVQPKSGRRHDPNGTLVWVSSSIAATASSLHSLLIAHADQAVLGHLGTFFGVLKSELDLAEL